MRRFGKGELHSGTGKKGKEGPVVTSRKQALAIALSACGKSKYAERLTSMGYTEEVAQQVVNMLFAETDWQDDFKTGKGGKKNPNNYSKSSRFQIESSILDSIDANKPRSPEFFKRLDKGADSEALTGSSLEQGLENPQTLASKQVQGMLMLG